MHVATAVVAIVVLSQLSPPVGEALGVAKPSRYLPPPPLVKRTEVAQQKDTVHHRAADIIATITNSRFYSGTFTASGVSRTCGNSMVFMNGNKDGFNFEFPYAGTFEINDVNFAADTLKVGVASSSYYIDLNLTTKDGGHPAGWVLRTNQPKYGETGTVLLTVKGSVATLRISGQNKIGEMLDMTVVCKAVVP